jgi:hypothetical protein
MPEPETPKRRSLFQILRLPEPFGVVLLTGSMVLLLSPYLAGSDFGSFKVPTFPPSTTAILRVLGPLAFLAACLLFIPLWPAHPQQVPHGPTAIVTQGSSRTVPGGARVTVTSPDSVQEALDEVIARYPSWRHLRGRFPGELATVAAELALNAFEHGRASGVVLGLYRYCVVIQDDGAAFNPLHTRRELTAAGGAGLFSLGHLLSSSATHVWPYYRRYRDRNELLLYWDCPVQPSQARFTIRLRGKVDRNDLHKPHYPHVLDLRWGYKHYVLDPDALYAQTFVTRVLSRENDLITEIMERIPPDAVLHLRERRRAGSMASTYYEEVALRYPGRFIVE